MAGIASRIETPGHTDVTSFRQLVPFCVVEMRLKRPPNLITLLLVLFVVAPRVTFAERLPVKTYTTADGLGHNNVTRIVRDSRGFLWFCTFEGLSRFDGYTFTTYTVDDGLPSPVVNDLLETREGEYWVATGAGLCRFDPKGRTGRRTTQEQPRKTGAMFTSFEPGDAGSRNVTSLLQDSRGVIWCGTSKGLYRLSNQDGKLSFSHIELGMPNEPESEIVGAIIEDSRAALWIGSPSGLYRLFADGRSEHYNNQQGLPQGINTNSLFEDREGRIWAGTRFGGGLCLLVSDPSPNRPVVARLYTEKDGLPIDWINQMYQASDGTMWAGTNRGLMRFIPAANGRDFQFRSYAQPHGLSYQEVQSLAEDRNGNLWLGMSNGGAIKIARSGITAFTEPDGFRSPRAIFQDRAANLFVMDSPNEGVSINRYDKERFTAIRPKLPKGFNSWGWNQLIIEDSDGEWWIATGLGVYRFPKVTDVAQLSRTPPKAIYTKRDGLAGDVILRLFEDSRGNIWIGTVSESGLSRWERATGTIRHFTLKDGLPFPDYPISFCEDSSGAIWIGFSIGGGLVRYAGGTFTRFTPVDGLAEGGIFNLFFDSRGRLWVPTTRGGVCRIDNPEAPRPAISIYTTADGLSSNSIRSVTEDRLGRIYLGTGRGIDRLDTTTGHIKRYTTADGVLPGETNAAFQDREGALWFSFVTGLIRFIPEPDQRGLSPPILITGLRIAGDSQSISALGEVDILAIELGPDKNQLQIEFVALGSPGEGLRYQYKLEGASDDWSALSDDRTVNFAKLAPDRYRFLVRAVNADGVVSDRPASFSFTILPPVWQRWWFIAIVGVLMGFTAYALYRYRVSRLLELERIRTRIASDLHDDIGAGLSRIAILSEVAHRRLDDGDTALNEPLSTISRASRELVDSMSDIVWAINPQREHLQDLTQRMRRFASDLFTARNIEVQFRLSGADQDLRLDAEVRREVFLIFKESVNNIARHSGCTLAEIELAVEGRCLTMRANDDGKGFDVTAATEGNGLTSLRQRAKKLNGKLEVISALGQGTAVVLVVPLSRRGSRERGKNGAALRR